MTRPYLTIVRTEAPDLTALYAENLQAEAPSTIERISEALNSPFWFGAYVGFIGGCFFTVIAAAVWTVML
jgi:hypothetical protein